MALFARAKKRFARFGILNKSKSLLPPLTSLASVESLTMPHVQEVVFSADLRCAKCQKRVDDIISRMDESVEVNVLEKKVTLICRYTNVVKGPTMEVAAIYRDPHCKVATMKRLLLPSCT